MAMMTRCPLTGEVCGKSVTVVDKSVFLAEPKDPADDRARRARAIGFALSAEHKLRSALEEIQPYAFTCKICEMIQGCAYGIADVSTGNANVLLELGMMIALGKPSVILCRKGSEGKLLLPSDLGAIEVVPFGDYIDILEPLKEVLAKLTGATTPATPIALTEQALREVRPDLASQIKQVLDDHKRDLAAEFKEAISQAKLDSVQRKGDPTKIPPDLKGRLDEFEAALKRVEALGLSTDANTALYRGNLHYNSKRYEAALAEYSRALELRPDFPEALNNRGNTYHELQRYDEALADYGKALQLRPDFPEALNNRGSTCHELQRYDEALADYSKALQLRPDLPDALNNRALTYSKLERYDEALADYGKALQFRPDFPDALNNRALTYSKLERYDEALADYGKALQLRPDYPDALNNRAITYMRTHRLDDALADLNAALRLRPDHPSSTYNLACLLSLTKKRDEAIPHLERAISLDAKYLQMAATDSDFDSIRDDPRFRKLMQVP